jgi:1-deoxyxylulose-5-phosphate synthase
MEPPHTTMRRTIAVHAKELAMRYTRLGDSGLTVSRIVMGCMSFGGRGTGTAWILDEDAADPVFRQAVELGFTFWDTANVMPRAPQRK